MRHLIAYIEDNWLKQQHPVRDLDTHILAATDWLLYSQRQTKDDGVPHSFDVRQNTWLPSYPETTGYIIPTLYDVASLYQRPECAEAAKKMSLWEAKIQLDDGGVMAGHIGAEVVAPTIFNTGQVLFGWARCVEETGDETSKNALIKAADWLVNAMDSDGCWSKFPSPFAPGNVKTYNVRCAFGLVKAFEVLQDQKYLDAAQKNVDWVLSQATKNKWLLNNCLTKNPDALTHTIAYAMRGIIEVGHILEIEEYISFGTEMAHQMIKLQNQDGSFPARVKSDWSSDYTWSCITGNSQLSLNFFRLSEMTGDKNLIKPACRANYYNMSLQDTHSKNLNIKGALKGSHPINGGYMTYRYPNWATKFFIDALIKEKAIL